MRIFILFLLAFSFQLNAQNAKTYKPGKKLVDAFEVETGKDAFFKSKGIKRAYKAYTIPEAFLKTIAKNPNIVFGVSDAQVDSFAALQQAIYRARVHAAMQKQTTFKWGGDFFKKEKANVSIVEKTIMYATISAINTPLPQIVPTDTIRNDFNETIIIAEISSTPSGKVNYKTELFNVINSVNHKRSVHARLSVFYKLEGGAITDSLLYKLMDSEFYLSTKYNAKKLPELNKVRKYYSFADTSQSEKELLLRGYSGATMLHGFWPAYQRALMLQLSNMPLRKTTTKSLDEVYSNTATKLGRDIAKLNVSFHVDSLRVVNNKLYLRLNVNSW